jgi:Gpi18-like mannosyltransferase
MVFLEDGFHWSLFSLSLRGGCYIPITSQYVLQKSVCESHLGEIATLQGPLGRMVFLEDGFHWSLFSLSLRGGCYIPITSQYVLQKSVCESHLGAITTLQGPLGRMVFLEDGFHWSLFSLLSRGGCFITSPCVLNTTGFETVAAQITTFPKMFPSAVQYTIT